MAMVPRWRVRDHLRPEVGTEYAVEWCRHCQYGRVAGKFTPSEIAGFYAAGYYTHEAHGATCETRRWLDRALMHLAWCRDRGLDLMVGEVTRAKAHPALCDVGCGGGPAMAKFKQAGYEAVGIEPDAAARVIAARSGEVFEGTAEVLPNAIEGRKFDVVLLSHVLEHCIDPVVALGNVKKLLAADGAAIIEVPNNAALSAETYGPAWFFADVPRHLHFFCEKSLREALERVGLKVRRTIYTGYTRQFSPEWLAAQASIRARIGADGWEPSPWLLLARTAFARDKRKYDSIRVHATHA
jgi:SAM-dependent methyltransferase